MRIEFIGNNLYAVIETGNYETLFTGTYAECEEYITINQN